MLTYTGKASRPILHLITSSLPDLGVYVLTKTYKTVFSRRSNNTSY